MGKSSMELKCFGCGLWDFNEDRCTAFICTKPDKQKPILRSSEIKKSLTQQDIDDIINKTEIITMTMFGKTTIVVAKLPNGFVLVESSSCVSPESYDEVVGIEICMEKIENKIWEMEGYKLQSKLEGK